MFVVSRGGGIPWPALSPDLAAYDYFLWGFLKSKAYLTKLDTDELIIIIIIKEEITATPDNMVREAMRTLCDRLEQCT